jgi:predicted double-glycine peptidase
LYRFLPISLFVFELATVYTMTAVALAHEHVTSVAQPEVTVSAPAREVRIEIINKVYPEIVNVVDEPIVAKVSEVVAVSSEDQNNSISVVPFYSQFADISSPQWQKVGCGIASVAMIIDHYSDETVSVDALLDRGVQTGAYIESAGWSHAGLIGLSHAYGLDGESVSMADLSMSEAFARLETILKEGPVMASVHYTFEPTNPIPHLVVVNGVRDGKVFYNDPAEPTGGGTISIEKFESAWKKRYISIRPVV